MNYFMRKIVNNKLTENAVQASMNMAKNNESSLRSKR